MLGVRGHRLATSMKSQYGTKERECGNMERYEDRTPTSMEEAYRERMMGPEKLSDLGLR